MSSRSTGNSNITQEFQETPFRHCHVTVIFPFSPSVTLQKTPLGVVKRDFRNPDRESLVCVRTEIPEFLCESSILPPSQHQTASLFLLLRHPFHSRPNLKQYTNEYGLRILCAPVECSVLWVSCLRRLRRSLRVFGTE
jgi:hypothetical protein